MKWTLKTEGEKTSIYINEEGKEYTTELIYEDSEAKWWTWMEDCLNIYYQQPLSDDELSEAHKEKIIDKSYPQYESLDPHNEDAVFFLRYIYGWLFNDCSVIRYRAQARVPHKRKEGDMF